MTEPNKSLGAFLPFLAPVLTGLGGGLAARYIGMVKSLTGPLPLFSASPVEIHAW